ncbi:MAG: hypothetical protein IJI22_01820 [Bacilli bacterium]|nr:hypothetical protein [Bacilli bacterium]
MKKTIIKNVVGALLFGLFFISFIDSRALPYAALLVGILVLGTMMFFWGLIYYLICRELFKSKKIYLKAAAILIFIGALLGIMGFIISLSSVGFDELYDVNKVQVVKVERNKLFIDYTEYSNGDYDLKEIKKPLFIKIKSGQKIFVRYPYNKPEKMHHIIGQENAGIILIIGLIIESIGGLIVMPYILLKNIKKKGNRK